MFSTPPAWARAPEGGFAGLLDRAASGRYARSAPGGRARRAFALDGHHILFHLNAAARLCGALDRPGHEPHRALLKAWRQPDLRLRQLCAAVAAPLGDDTMTTGFRRQFARLLSPEWIGSNRDWGKAAGPVPERMDATDREPDFIHPTPDAGAQP